MKKERKEGLFTDVIRLSMIKKKEREKEKLQM